jgi:hypothetical protein
MKSLKPIWKVMAVLLTENGAEKTIVQAVSCCFKIYLSCPKEG